MSKQKIFFRADGNSSTGLGHVIRLLALADMINELFTCTFAIQNPSEALREQILNVCHELIILPEQDESNVSFYRELELYLTGNEIVVLDGYRFDTFYQHQIKQLGSKLICIDDIHAVHFVADAVINHGLPQKEAYSTELYTKIYLGPRYALLRPAFLLSNNIDNTKDNELSVFICFGGADPSNLTSKYLQYLLDIPYIDIIYVVTGSAYRYCAELKKIIKNTNKVVWHQNLSSEAMAASVASAKIAIVPGSTIALECASVGIGLICGHYVPNQIYISNGLSHYGMAYNISDMNKVGHEELKETIDKVLQPETLGQMLSQQKKYFDGSSKQRLISLINNL